MKYIMLTNYITLLIQKSWNWYENQQPTLNYVPVMHSSVSQNAWYLFTIFVSKIHAT